MENQNKLDMILAASQIGLSVLFILSTFIVLGIVFTQPEMTAGQQRVFDVVVDLLKTGTMLILFFWFQRQRSAGIASPAEPAEPAPAPTKEAT